MGNICPKFFEEEKSNRKFIKAESESFMQRSILFDNDPLIPISRKKNLKKRIYRREYLTEMINENMIILNFKQVIKKLESLKSQQFQKISYFQNEKFEEKFSVEIEGNSHKYYISGKAFDNSPSELIYAPLFSLTKQENWEKLYLEKYQILAHFEIENMIFFLMKLHLKKIMLYKKNEFLFVKGIKKISENEYLEINESIPVDESYGDKSSLNTLEKSYSHYFRYPGKTETYYRTYTEINFKNVNLGFSSLKPILSEMRLKLCEKIEKILKEDKMTSFDFKEKIKELDKIYKEE